MKRNLTILLIILFSTNLPAFSQTFCRNAEAGATAGELEKHVYKTYLDKKGNEKEDLFF